jgi:phosphoribosyl isomerase A
MPNLILLPAVDVADGQAVRLEQAAAGSEKSFGDPLEVAENFVEQGAEWLHLVDLDAAFSRGENTAVIRRVVDALAGKLNIQLSGGIRDEASLNRALDAGVRRVNLGTAALADIDFVTRAIREHGDRVVVGIDVRGTTLTARGGTGTLGELFDVLPVLGRSRSRPIHRHRRRHRRHDDRPQHAAASGCLRTNRRTSNCLWRNRHPRRHCSPARPRPRIGVEGAILGKALYEGAFTLREALAVANGA